MSETKYLEDIIPDVEGCEEITVENVLKEFSTVQLRDLTVLAKTQFYVPKEIKRSSRDNEKSFLIEHISEECRARGIKSLLLEFSKFYMHILTKKMEIEILESNGNNRNRLPVQRKRCYELMTEMGVRKYLEKYVESESDLTKLIEYFSRKPWGKGSEILVDQLCEIFDSSSLMNMLSKLPKSYLLQVLEEIDLKVPKEENHSPYVLADFIVYGSVTVDDEDSNDVENLEINLSRKKPSKIDNKCTRDDLIHYFVTEDLKNFCKDVGMVGYGKKVQIVNRIMEYFEDKEEALKTYNPEIRREKKKEKVRVKRDNEAKRKIKMEEKKEQARIEKQKLSQDIDEKHNDEEEKVKSSKKDNRKISSKKSREDSNEEESPKSSKKDNKKSSKKNEKSKGSKKTQDFDDDEVFDDSLEDDSKEKEQEEEPLRKKPSIKGRTGRNKRHSDKRNKDSRSEKDLSESLSNLSVDDKKDKKDDDSNVGDDL